MTAAALSKEAPPAEVIHTKSGEVLLRHDGLVVLKPKAAYQHELSDAQEVIAAVRRLAAGGKVWMLADIRNTGAMSRPARRLFGDSSKRLILGMAILVGSPFSRMVGSLFVRLGRPQVPGGVFTDEEQAVTWLGAFQ